MTERHVCVHGHFYQPPREDPLSGEMPIEVAAAPFSNFNEKIHAECYAPNAELGNFARMSFNIGPTLASWMRRYHPDDLARIAASDRSAVDSGGFGSAIAQSYHHTILPLANERDRRTEIHWGVRSFELLYGRKPLGIWLPETAVDTATLEDCADHGIVFTILAPGQIGVDHEPGGSYRLNLPSGRRFEAIVYDGHLGGTVSFYPIATTSAGEFTDRHILPAFGRENGTPAMVAVATDGEVYGHHHPFKDLFLRELLSRSLEERGLTRVTAEQFVMSRPAARTVSIVERSSWGCPHALARWSAGCSCTAGIATWKQPLRGAFDTVADLADDLFDGIGREHLSDPWAARDDYVDVVDGALSFDDWFDAWRRDGQSDAAKARVILEAQRHRLAMYASCAFYWEDVSRIEPGYGIQRGLAAALLLDREFGTSIVASFVDRLSLVHSARVNRSAAALHASTWIPAPAR